MGKMNFSIEFIVMFNLNFLIEFKLRLNIFFIKLFLMHKNSYLDVRNVFIWLKLK